MPYFGCKRPPDCRGGHRLEEMHARSREADVCREAWQRLRKESSPRVRGRVMRWLVEVYEEMALRDEWLIRCVLLLDRVAVARDTERRRRGKSAQRAAGRDGSL